MTAILNVKGTELLQGDARESYRQKIARITLDSMVQFVGLLDAAGTVLEINQVALDAVGIKLSDVEGKPFWTTFWWQVSEEINATLKESIRRAAQGEFVRWDTEIYGRAGGKETIIIDASLMPVKDEQGNVVFIAAEGRDITEKIAYEHEIERQRRELARLDEVKTHFFANISHEFRTPLTLMLGPLEDILNERETAFTQAEREKLALAHRNAQRLLKLVNALLDFSRIEAGRMEATYAPVDLSALTADLASTFRSAVTRAGLRFVVDCPPLPQPIFVDRDMWEKVIFNLLSNAFKFTFEGEIAVVVRWTGNGAELIVRDTGTGIEPEHLPHLFERFYRAQNARSRTHEGSGIGLALVHELVKLHGGDIQVESERGRGTCFRVKLQAGSKHLAAERIEAPKPLAPASRANAFVEEALHWLPDYESTGDQQRKSPTPSRSGAARARILWADDNSDMRDYVTRMLSPHWKVEAVADGQAALESARRDPPDLVLTDVMMPKLDGFGLLRELRADARTRAVPVIVLSARAGEEAKIEGLDAGADDYLIKPFTARELIARVRTHLKMSRARKDAASKEFESDAWFNIAAKAARLATWYADPDTWSGTGDASLMRMLGLPAGRGPLSADVWSELIHPEDREHFREEFAACASGLKPLDVEFRIQKPSGEVRWLASHGDIVRGIMPARIVGVARDITEQKQQVNAQELMSSQRNRGLSSTVKQ